MAAGLRDLPLAFAGFRPALPFGSMPRLQAGEALRQVEHRGEMHIDAGGEHLGSRGRG